MSPATHPGQVMTVLGPVSPQELGPTMTHEHLLIDFSCIFKPPSEATLRARAYAPLTMENLGWIRYHHFSNINNLLVLDEETAIQEAALYRRVGGGCIVDATTIGIGRDPLALARISRAAGVHVVMGAGWYVAATHPEDMGSRDEEDLARQIIQEVQEGVGDTGVRAGIIGEIGCTWPLEDNEAKVLRAAAVAQRETGAAVLIHPGRHPDAPGQILEILAEAGADIGRVIMGHLDRTIPRLEPLLELAASGCYLEFDLFGNESSYYPLADIDMPSDAQRMDLVKGLIEAGYGDRVLLAHDICTNHRLVRYGGHGFGHILENILPRLRKRGCSAEQVRALVVDNPARILALADYGA